MSEDKIWYIALNDEQVGPLSQDEVRAEIEAGQVTGSTYIWRDGLEDWVMAADATEFADAIDAGEPDIADVAGESVDAFFASYDSPSNEEDDAAAASVAAATSVDTSDTAGPSGLAATSVASRSDDSVLFSLDELAATTQRVSQTETSTTDGSGLIDLSALASTASTIGSATARTTQPADDEKVASAPLGAAPVALAPPKKSVLPLVLLGVAAVAIIGLLVAIFLLLGKKDEAPPVAEAPTTDTVAQDDDGEDKAEEQDKGTEVDAAAAADAEEADAPEEPEAPEAPEKAEEPKAAAPSAKKPSSSSSSSAKADPKPAAKPSTASSSSKSSGSSSAKSSGSGGGDSVSAALASISGDSSSSSSPSAGSGGATLSDTQIRSTVRRYNGKVQNCKKDDGDAGTYRVAFAIANNGSTSQVTPRDSGAAASCVADVVKTMRFPSFDGPERKLTYTFAIR